MSNRLNAIGMDTTTGQFNISDPDDVMMVPAIVGNSGTPGITVGAALGTGAGTPTIVGNNLAGKITFTTATLSVVAGTVFTLTFANSLTFPNAPAVIFSPGNDNFGSVSGLLYTDPTTTTIVLKARLGLGINTTYIGFYHCIGW